MPTSTKKAIEHALFTLLKERPLSEVTVNDITSLCGVSRKTFYYYHQDIYSLVFKHVESVFETVTADENYDFWSVYERLIELITENHDVVINVYNCVDHRILYNFLHRTLQKYFRKMILREAHGLSCTQEDIDVVSNLCLTGALSVTLQWLHFNMACDITDEFIRHRKKLEGFSRLMLINMSDTSHDHAHTSPSSH